MTALLATHQWEAGPDAADALRASVAAEVVEP
jgi:hypothetical protein